ncbi:MAG TPA: histone deacetylase family protein [Rhizomicrobium sp.]|jgi:acetoin utilization deacetylase AcuC-like enzyme
MRTGLVTSPACFGHKPPAGHPERPERLTAVLAALESQAFRDLDRRAAPKASPEEIGRAHSNRLIEKILEQMNAEAGDSGYAFIDGDTVMSPASADAALHAAGAAIAAVDAVMRGEVKNAFCAVRPPGHHAERDRAMGFCLFNNVAVAALHARAAHHLNRVAVVDFDVHHGNGTQDIFFDDANLFYASTHQMPLYPATGYPSETGVARNVINCPLPPSAGSAQFRAIYKESVLPTLADFAPEFIFISAGFDAHRADPLANLELDENDFAWATHEICAIARDCAGGRVVSALEGGYDLSALQRSAAEHVRALMEA